MRPTDFATQQRLDYARSHAEDLRREWLAVNGRRHIDSAADSNRRGAVATARGVLGRGLVRFGVRLLPARNTPDPAARGYRPDPC
jgi:hypothetical protein